MLQTGEIIIIALLALVVLGPSRLPEIARKLGKWTAELRQAAREITAGLEAEVAEFKEIGNDLKGPLDEVKKPFNEIRDQFDKAARGHEWKGPKPLSGPTPADAMRDLEELNARGLGDAGPDSEPSLDDPAGTDPSDADASPNVTLGEDEE